MELAREPADERGDTAPFGFAARVVARSQLMAKPSLLGLQRAFSAASWAAAFVIVSCSVVLLQHQRAADPASEILVAAQRFAEAISP